MVEDSYLLMRDGRISAYIGPDATAMFGAMSLRGALRLWKYGIRINRRVPLRQLLDQTSHITGKKYSARDIDAAMDDLTAWIDAMKCALPIVTETTKSEI